MGGALVARYTTHPEAGDENQRLVQNVFTQLADEQPDGLHYLVLRLADGSFVHVVVLDGEDNALPGLSNFKEFQRGIDDRVVEPPVLHPATVVGSYGFGSA
jgi:hypothetical protein